MDSTSFCAYNLTKDAFLSSKVTVADAALEPLKVLEVLIGGLGLDSESSLWLTPLSAAPEVPRLFPFDMVYLDGDHRVIHGIEVVPGADLPPYSSRVASALILPDRTLSSTQTHPGDQIKVCAGAEMRMERARISVAPVPVADSHRTAIPAERSSPRIPIEKIRVDVHTASDLFELFPTPPVFMPAGTAEASQTAEMPQDPILRHWIDKPADPNPANIAAGAQPAESQEQSAEFQVEVLETPALSPPHAAPALAEAAEPPVQSLQKAVDSIPPAIGPIAAGQSIVEALRTPLVAASSAATPATPSIDHPEDESRSAPFAVADTLPASQSVQFTATQTPIWRVSTPAFAAQIARGMESPESSSETPESKTRGQRTSASVNQSPVKVTAKPPAEQITAKPPAGQVTAKPPLNQVAAKPAMERPPIPHVAIPPTPTPIVQREKPAAQLSSAPASTPPAPAEIAPRTKPPARPDTSRPVLQQTPITPGTNGTRSEAQKNKAFYTPRSGQLSPEMLAEVQQLIERQKLKDKERQKQRRGGTDNAGAVARAAEPAKAPQRARPKAPEKLSLTTKFQHWLDADLDPAIEGPRDRRMSVRHRMPGMVSYHWTGGTPRPHQVVDISDTGFYLITDDRWIPQTMLRMTLQRPDKKEGNPKHAITVLARVVRIGADGVGHEFVWNETLNRNTPDILPDQATDRKALRQFL
jgi:hypothetical protein